jgi:hypothetical protein
MKVYLLTHFRNETELDGFKTIGIFSSEERAKEASERLKLQPGFRDYHENFNVAGYEMDKTFWVGALDSNSLSTLNGKGAGFISSVFSAAFRPRRAVWGRGSSELGGDRRGVNKSVPFFLNVDSRHMLIQG